MRVPIVVLLAALLSACSDAPPPKKEAEAPPMPISGRQGFQYVYGSARLWASDALPLTVRSLYIPEVKSEPGKAAAWEVVFVSESMARARTYSWSAVETEGIHKGVFPGPQQSWSPGAQKPFSPAAVMIDTNEALEAATKVNSQYLEKSGKKPPVNYLLESAVQFPDPVWRVMWGGSVSSAESVVTIDAMTGKVVGKD